MEEKKPINIRLSTAILLFIILILIGVIICFVLQNNMLQNRQKSDETKTQNTQNQINQIPETSTNTTENTTIKNTASTTPSRVNEDTNKTSVVGLDMKFTELSEAAVTKYNLEKIQTINYDLNNDGNKKKFETRENKEGDYSLYYDNKLFESHLSSNFDILYIVDLNRADKYLDVIVKSVTDTGGGVHYSIYKNDGKNLRKIEYESKPDTGYAADIVSGKEQLYLNGKDSFFEISDIETFLDKIMTENYYTINNYKAINNMIDKNKIIGQQFTIIADVNSSKYLKDAHIVNNNPIIIKAGTKVTFMNWTENEYSPAVLEIKLEDESIRYIYVPYA